MKTLKPHSNPDVFIEMLKQVSSVYYQNDNRPSQIKEKTSYADQFIETTTLKQECQGQQQEKKQIISSTSMRGDHTTEKTIAESVEAMFVEGIRRLIKETKKYESMPLCNARVESNPLFDLLTNDATSLLTPDTKTEIQHLIEHPLIEVCTKAHDDVYLQIWDESQGDRPCVNDDDCEAMIIAKYLPPLQGGFKDGFVCKQYRTPKQISTGQWSSHGLCLLCYRKKVTFDYHRRCIQNGSASNLIVPFRVIVDRPGEYSSNHILSSVKNQSLDCFIQYSRRDYSYCVTGKGCRMINQDALSFKPGVDFGLPLTIPLQRGSEGQLHRL